MRTTKRLHPSRAALATIAALAVMLGALPVEGAPARRGETSSPAPNVVLILTDDQRAETLWAMPHVEKDLVQHGTTFTNGFVVNSLCCPSRASILTGQYSKHTGVYRNAPPFGGYQSFRDSSTIATWLHGAGYRTALVGKYLNGYNNGLIPPGWDRWYAFEGLPRYYDYQVNDQGTIRSMGSAPRDYSTLALARRAVAFVRTTTSPFFLYFAPFAPHLPAVPATRDVGTFRDLPPFRPPSFDEQDVSDKPAWVQGLQPFDQGLERWIDRDRLRQYASLQAVDRAVGELVAALAKTGALDHTLIVFTSDNGLSWGEHRWALRKEDPYEASIRVPLVVRYDALATGPRTDDHLALNIDLAPTFADAAGVASPSVDGSSLLPLLTNASASWRTDFLIEHLHLKQNLPPPTYCAVRSDRYLYVFYDTGEQELYDLQSDPYELDNRAGDPAYADALATMQSRLRTLCSPPPPGLALP